MRKSSKSKSSKSKSKDKDKKEKKDKKDKNSDKKSKSSKSKSKKSSRSNSKDKIISSKGTEKNININESINPDVSGINKEIGQNNNLDLTYTQCLSNKNNQMNNNNNIILQNGVPKCDGCFENDSLCYCKECKKYLCNICENQIHIIPVNSNHLRVNLGDIIQMKKLCYHHQFKLELFCESCDEAICKQCQIIGPHNTNYHRIIEIREAFNKKYYQLSKMKPILMNKLTELNYYNNKVNDLTEKVNVAKKDLIRDIRAQYTTLSEKIKDVEGKRNAILSFETSQLQYDSNNIKDIDNYISDVQSRKGPLMINFILQYPQLKNKMERLLEKPLKEKIDLSNIENYPNDLEERHKILEEYDKIESKLETKNDAIWKLINEKKQKEKSILDKAKKKSMEQIEEKAKLSDKYDKDLKKYIVVCAFCGKYIDKKTVNSECQANEQFYLNFYFTKEAPPLSLINTKRHYFGEPVNNNLSELLKLAESMWDKQRAEIGLKLKEEEKIQQEQNMQNINDMNNNNMMEDNINITVKETSIKKEVIKEDQIKDGNQIRRSHEFRDGGINSENKNGKEIVKNLGRIIEEKNIDLFTLLSGYDLDEDGDMEVNELKLALHKIIQLNQNDFESILKFFNLGERINIKDFIYKFNQSLEN